MWTCHLSSKDSSEETHLLIVPFGSLSKRKGGKKALERTKEKVDKTLEAKGEMVNQTIGEILFEGILNILNSVKALMV